MNDEEHEIKTETIDIEETWLSNPSFSADNHHGSKVVKTSPEKNLEINNDFVSIDDSVDFVKCEFPDEIIDSQENVEEDPLMLDIEADVHKGIRSSPLVSRNCGVCGKVLSDVEKHIRIVKISPFSKTWKCQLCADQELCSIIGAKKLRKRNSSSPGNKPSFDGPKTKKNSSDSLDNDTPKPAKRKKSNCKKALSKKFDPPHQNKKKDVKIFRRPKKYECKKCFQKSFLTLKGFQFHQTEVHGGVTENVHESNSYECKICNEDFSSSQGLKNHEKEVHVGKKHSCDKCNKIFMQKFNLEKHIRNVHDEIKRVCPICNKAFSSKESLKKHITVIHEVKKYECTICEKSFSYLYELETHQKSVHDGIKHVCVICNKGFKYNSDLTKHTRKVHLNERKEYKCETCEKSFYNKGHLNEHIKVHGGVTKNVHESNSYECKICNEDFSSLQGLKNHEKRVHDGIKRVCAICNKAFSSKESLKKHITVIHGVKEYECKTCEKSFSYLYELETHQKAVHDGIKRKIYKCRICSKTYSYRNGLAEHTRNVHLNEGKEYKCETCGKSFRSKCYLKEHIKGIHEGKKYQCKTCEKSYVSFSMLKKHQAIVHKGIKHIKNIHEDKKYECELCKQSYMSLEGLKIHQTLAHDEMNHSKKLEWVEDALNLPDVEEILDEDENDLETSEIFTSIVIDPNLVEEIQEPIIKKRKKNVPNLKEPIQESQALRKNCPNCNKSIDSKFLAKHIKNCKSQEVAIETDITEKSQDLDVSVEEIVEDENIIDLGPNHLLL